MSSCAWFFVFGVARINYDHSLLLSQFYHWAYQREGTSRVEVERFADE